METVCQLDEDDTYVVVHRKEYLLEVFSLQTFCLVAALFGSVFLVENYLHLGKAVYQRGHLLTEEVLDVLYRILGILDYIVEEGGYDRLVSEADVGDNNLSHLNRVDDIWHSRTAAHIFVGLVRELEGFLDHLELIFGTAAGLSRLRKRSVFLLNKVEIFFGKFRIHTL